jgi:hypothetical protein
MKLYLAHGEDRVQRIFIKALVALARDEPTARSAIAHAIPGFRVDEIESVKDYPRLNVRPAVVARITLPEAISADQESAKRNG